MTDVIEQIMHVRDEVLPIRCCGKIVGVVNTRPFTPAAVLSFCAIQERVGSAWPDDAEAKRLMADPASYAPPSDGTACPFTCRACGATFVFVAGEPKKRLAT